MLIRNEQVTSKHIKQHNKFVIFVEILNDLLG